MLKNYKMEEVNCGFCGSSEYEIYIEGAKELYNNLEGEFNVVKCTKCGFIFTNPRPTQDTMKVFYPDTAGYYQPEHQDALKKTWKHDLFRNILANHYGYPFEHKLSKILTTPLYFLLSRKLSLLHIPKFSPEKNLLDIGCSWGGYMNRMKELGWNVFGIEMHEKAVGFAKKKLLFKNVSCTFIEDMEFEDNFFDVVHMSMVLEHVYDPLGTLMKIYKITKQNGQLILSVPDISGFEARIYKDKCYALHVPQHLSHFTPKTLKNFLQKAGFSVERIVHQNFDRDIVASAGYMQDKLLYSFLSNKVIRTTIVKLSINLLSLFEKSSRMSVFARKWNG